MKSYAVIAVICVEYSDFEYSDLLNVARSFLLKLEINWKSLARMLELYQRAQKYSNRTGIIITPQFIQRIQNIFDYDPWKLMSVRVNYGWWVRTLETCGMHWGEAISCQHRRWKIIWPLPNGYFGYFTKLKPTDYEMFLAVWW